MSFLRQIFVCGMFMLPVMSLQADTASFVTGIEYQEIYPAQNTVAPTGQIEVVELFWYGCPHCGRLEPHLKTWLKNKPANVHFVRIPAQFNKGWPLHAAAYYTAESLGLLDKMHEAFFIEIHEKHNKLSNVDQLAVFFSKFGVEREKFLKVFNSFAIKNKLAYARAVAKRYGARSVPAFVINGKYRTNETMAGSRDAMFKVIEELVGLESSPKK